jgi:hypothetical protein
MAERTLDLVQVSVNQVAQTGALVMLIRGRCTDVCYVLSSSAQMLFIQARQRGTLNEQGVLGRCCGRWL